VSVTSFLSTAVHPRSARAAGSANSTPGLVSRVRELRADARGRRELQLALSGYYGPSMQADVAAMQAHSR